MKQRLDWIDQSKGLGIVLVVYGHVARGLNDAGLTFLFFKEIDAFIYSFHMPLFFCLSGFFFIKSLKKGIRNFAKSKFSSLLYPYLVWSFIQVCVQFLVSNYINGTIGVTDLLTFFLPRGQFWFLLALFLIAICNAALFRLFKWYGILLSTILSLAFFLFQPNFHFFNSVLENLLFFNAGILFAWGTKNNKSILVSQFSWILNLISFTVLSWFLLTSPFNEVILKILLGLSGSLLVIQLCNGYFSPFLGHLKSLGNQSMTIYLLHILAGSGIRIVITKLFHVDNVTLHIIIGTLFGVYFPYLLHKYRILNRFEFLFKPPFRLLRFSKG